MRIAEIYRSVQGEGLLTGTPCVFVRASGCNLRCGFCDTPYASWDPVGDDLSVDEIVATVEELGEPHVVLTGGEPMLFSELVPLCERLQQRRKHITIETAGTLYLPLKCDLMSISPKLSNSTPPASSGRWQERHERTRHVPDVVRKLLAEHTYQLKFVCQSEPDGREVLDYLDSFPELNRDRVMLMPEGTEQRQLLRVADWLESFCAEHQLTFCPRRQIEWFGMQRGT